MTRHNIWLHLFSCIILAPLLAGCGSGMGGYGGSAGAPYIPPPPPPAMSCGNEFYVSPAGSSSGDGGIDNPWDLQTALSHPAAVLPGDCIWLLGEVYRTSLTTINFDRYLYRSFLTGTPEAPIIVRQFPGQRAIIDGALPGETTKNVSILKIYGTDTWFMDFEITNLDPNGRILTAEDPGGDESNRLDRRGSALELQGLNIRLINLIIYDAGQGIGAWGGASNAEIYGNVIFNNGWDSTSFGSRMHGQGIYTQNKDGYKRYQDNIVLNNFDHGIQMYGSDQAFLNNFIWEGNVLFNDAVVFGGGTPIRNLTLRNNYFYNHAPALGYSNPDNDGALITGNLLMAGLFIKLFKNVTVTDNVFWDTQGGRNVALYFDAPGSTAADFHFDRNLYYRANPDHPYNQFSVVSSSRSCTYAWFNRAAPGYGYCGADSWSWQEDLGYDLNGSYIAQAPSGVQAFVRPNAYDPGRANVVIYNWDLLNTVSADVSSVLNPGDSYELRNVQDYFGDVLTGTYAGGSLSVPMTGHTVAKPLGYSTMLEASTFPKFGVFVLIKR